MSENMREVMPIAGVLGTIVVAFYLVVQLNGQQPAGMTADFTNATTGEVRDAQGQVVLRGQFVVGEDGDEIERKTALEPTGVDADAAGDAEVEFAKSTPATQEVEFSVRNAQAGRAYTFVIDGSEVATVTADRRGRAEVELDVTIPGIRNTRR